MFKSRSQRREAEEQKRKQLWGRDFNIVKNGLDEEQVIDFVNELVTQPGAASVTSVGSIIKTAIKGAEQIIDSIKMRARAEAEEEAARIIAQAKQEAAGIGGAPITTVEKEVEDILSVANKTVEEKVEEPTEPQEEVADAEPVAAVEEPLEQRSPQQKETREGAGPVLSKQDRQFLYTGEVELAVGVPVGPNMVAKLYNYLQTTPEIKFVRTSGSWNRGTSITVVLDKPIPLISVISSKIPEAKVIPEQPGIDGFVKGRKGVRRISIVAKES